MNVVRHHHKGVQRHVWALHSRPPPFLGDDLTAGIQPRFRAHHLTKQRFAFMGADGKEIGACGSVVVPLQANGAPVEHILMVGHWLPFLILRFSGNDTTIAPNRARRVIRAT